MARKLEDQRPERYGHLSEDRFQRLTALALSFSEVLVIEGMEGGVVEGYEFDIELEPDAKPVWHQLPKMSVREMEKEQYHCQQKEALKHLHIPTDEQKSEWSTRTHVVFKKDDPMGRRICDFRLLNAVTKKRPTPIGDVFAKTMLLAGRRWKSGFDAWSGFN